jgi:hypothetical protein
MVCAARGAPDEKKSAPFRSGWNRRAAGAVRHVGLAALCSAAMSSRFMGLAALAAATLWLIPAAAAAWGPVAHLDCASLILQGAVAVAPVLLRLLARHPDDFLYGALAADAVVAKNLAREGEHSHSWAVARSLLKAAQEEGDAREAFILGYVAHLGADVVAHNYVVPQLLVAHFRVQRAGHVYWEARTDQRLLELRPELGQLWNDLARRRFKEHDRFLSARLRPTLLPNRVSARLYRHTLDVLRRGAWQVAVSRVDERSALLLPQDELLRWRALALEASRKALNNPLSARLLHLDPTGRDALRRAADERRALRKQLRRGTTEDLEAAHLLALARVRTVDVNLFEPDD